MASAELNSAEFEYYLFLLPSQYKLYQYLLNEGGTILTLSQEEIKAKELPAPLTVRQLILFQKWLQVAKQNAA